MTMFLHKYTGDNRCLDKWTYSDPPATGDSKKSIDVYQLTSILAPQVTLDYDSTVLTAKYNYCYIKEWGRYFYITDISCDSGKKIILTLAVDVLNTFKAEIKNSPATVIRSEKANRSQIFDNQYPLSTTQKYYVQLDAAGALSYDDTGYHYVLGVNAISS